MVDQSRGDAIDTNKTQAAEHAFRAEMLGEKASVPQSILKREQGGFRVQQRRDEIDEFLVSCGFDRNQNKIARTNLIRRVVGPYFPYAKAFLFAPNSNPKPLDLVKAATDKKMNVPSIISQLTTIVAADCACTDNGDAKPSR